MEVKNKLKRIKKSNYEKIMRWCRILNISVTELFTMSDTEFKARIQDLRKIIQMKNRENVKNLDSKKYANNSSGQCNCKGTINVKPKVKKKGCRARAGGVLDTSLWDSFYDDCCCLCADRKKFNEMKEKIYSGPIEDLYPEVSPELGTSGRLSNILCPVGQGGHSFGQQGDSFYRQRGAVLASTPRESFDASNIYSDHLQRPRRQLVNYGTIDMVGSVPREKEVSNVNRTFSVVRYGDGTTSHTIEDVSANSPSSVKKSRKEVINRIIPGRKITRSFSVSSFASLGSLDQNGQSPSQPHDASKERESSIHASRLNLLGAIFGQPQQPAVNPRISEGAANPFDFSNAQDFFANASQQDFEFGDEEFQPFAGADMFDASVHNESSFRPDIMDFSVHTQNEIPSIFDVEQSRIELPPDFFQRSVRVPMEQASFFRKSSLGTPLRSNPRHVSDIRRTLFPSSPYVADDSWSTLSTSQYAGDISPTYDSSRFSTFAPIQSMSGITPMDYSSEWSTLSTSQYAGDISPTYDSSRFSTFAPIQSMSGITPMDYSSEWSTLSSSQNTGNLGQSFSPECAYPSSSVGRKMRRSRSSPQFDRNISLRSDFQPFNQSFEEGDVSYDAKQINDFWADF